MKTKLFFGMLTAAATLAVAPAVFATDDPTVDTIEKEYKREVKDSSGDKLKGFTGTSYTTEGTVEGYGLVLPSGNVYFTGGEGSSLTITSITNTPNSSGYTYKTDNAFIVEGTTVILDGTSVNVEELGLNLTVGTMESATLKITGGAKVTTGAFYNTVGSNYATGTIEISGEGSELNTQQITLGAGDGSLATKTDDFTEGGYYTQYLITTDEARAILAQFKEGAVTDASYGIVNVKDGGTWSITGTASADNYYQSKLQLYNGEINIDGAGSQLLLGTGSCLTVMGGIIPSGDLTIADVTGLHYTEKITVTNGGKIANAEDATPFQVTLGSIWCASNDVVTVLVSGSDENETASTFDVHAYYTSWIGSNAGYWSSSTGAMDGGTQNVTITAEKGGVFRLSSDGGIVVAWDGYEDDFYPTHTSGASYGLNVDITAESGGSLTLESEKDEIILGAGAPATKDATGAEANYTNNVNVTANGEGSSVSLSAALNITANYDNADTVYVTLKATDGGAMTISADGGTVLNKNTSVIVEKGSSLTTVGAVLFNEGSSISVDGTSKWTGGDVEFASGSSLSITAGASAISTLAGDASANVSLGDVTISQGASIIVTIDISSLDNYTDATVAILTANSIVFDYTGGETGTTLGAGNTITGDSSYSETLASFVAGYIVCEENGFTIDSWSYTDGTLYANIQTMPEPSMFGMLFGLSALGLVSTRRRRRKA